MVKLQWLCFVPIQITGQSIERELHSGLKYISFLGKFGVCDIQLLGSLPSSYTYSVLFIILPIKNYKYNNTSGISHV